MSVHKATPRRIRLVFMVSSKMVEHQVEHQVEHTSGVSLLWKEAFVRTFHLDDFDLNTAFVSSALLSGRSSYVVIAKGD